MKPLRALDLMIGGGIVLLFGAVALKYNNSAHLSQEQLDKLTEGKTQTFTQTANGHTYDGQSWPRVNHLAIYMIWPKGQADEWVSYVHDNRDNSRKLHRKSTTIQSEILDQMVKDYGIEGA